MQHIDGDGRCSGATDRRDVGFPHADYASSTVVGIASSCACRPRT
jgi:hypothetical protein